jgi:hypothetical protein
MKYRNFLEREGKGDDFLFTPSMGVHIPKVGVMKFTCDSDEMKLHTKDLLTKACRLCNNKLKQLVGECSFLHCKLYGNGVFACYHELTKERQ